jgi:hypothetical protein
MLHPPLAPGPACDPRLLVNGLFDRAAPSSLANAFLMAELANAAYPTGMAVVANTKLGTAAYQAAFTRKWVGPYSWGQDEASRVLPSTSRCYSCHLHGVPGRNTPAAP